MSLEVIQPWLHTLSLVFGGCCSNAITLENLTTNYPGSGTLITFLQFLVITLYCLPSHIQWTSTGPRLAPRKIPLGPYIVQVLLFYFISLLNNWAFEYNVPMSVHIIFRSAGLVVSLVLGWLIGGKRYTLGQVLSVLVVSVGVLLTTMSASDASSKPSAASNNTATATYFKGIFILSVALILSGFLGLVQDYTYSNLERWQRASSPSTATASDEKQTHQSIPSTPALQATSSQFSIPPQPGSNGTVTQKQPPPWKESLFYLHFLALPLFIFVRHDIVDQITAIHTTSPKIPFTFPLPSFLATKIPIPPPHTLPLSFKMSFSVLSDFAVVSSGHTSHTGPVLTLNVPGPFIPLLLNTLTQLICVAGVHRLTTQVSALSVTMVLVLRKAVSLVISVLDVGVLLPEEVKGLLGHKGRRLGQPEVDMRLMWSGAVLVLAGSVWYSVESGRKQRASRKEKKE